VGASGFLGRSVVRALSEDGYEVRGLVRDGRKADLVHRDGGAPLIGDILDVPSLRAAAVGCAGIVHVAANPTTGDEPRQVRVEGARNLVDVARGAGVLRLLIGSGYWVYRGQPEPIDEGSPVAPLGESQINYEAERAGLEANSSGRLDVMVARPGMIYGSGSWLRGMAESIRAGEYRVVGTGANRWSFVELGDAGAAFRSVLESGRPGEVYNVVDGHPETLRTFVDLVASELGVPPPGSISEEAAVREMGEAVAHHLAADRPTSNGKLTDLGWKPKVPSVRAGLPPVLREMSSS
jgi:nucleoside-diphosphate-sugar epimerase